ncbi:MAG TPA: type II toxin-antitoxin system VapC family toxin [Terriglobia bacterium]|jgi:predicted nucleic acid-binding protein
MIHLDTSALVDSLTGKRRSGLRLRQFIENAERVHLSALVFYEWRRGPRQPQEIKDQEDLFPADQIVTFGAAEALIAARLYRQVKRPRGREIDIAIAACAIAHNADLWTLNAADFKDIPNLKLA